VRRRFKAENNRDKLYLDISDILALKQEGRRRVAKRPFGMKIAMTEAMRERLAPLKGFVSYEDPKLQSAITVKCETTKIELSLAQLLDEVRERLAALLQLD
jgi:hypothetical protein